MDHSKEQHFFHLIQVLEFGLRDNLVCLINICSLAFYYWNNLHGLSPLMMFINCNLLFTTIINLFQNIHGYFLSKLFQFGICLINICSLAFYYWNNLHGLSPSMMFINCNLLFTTIINLFQNIHEQIVPSA